MFCARPTNTVTHPSFKSSSEMQTSISPFLSLHPQSHSFLPSTRHTLSLSAPQSYAPPSPPPLLIHPRPPRFDYAPSYETRPNCIYLKRRKVELARQVFDEIPKRDVNAWSTMITGFARNGMLREVWEYTRLMLEEGINPNLVVMTVILDVIGKFGGRNLGREAHGFVLKMNIYYKELSIQSALIDMYWNCGDVGSGSRVLYSVMKRYGDCWIGLMSGRLEVEMRSIVRLKRFRPGAVAVASLLPICAQLRALKQGKEIHAYALRHWLLPNVPIVSSLMVLYSKCGMIEYSLRLFDGMEQKNVVSWTAMIDSCVENGHLCEATGVMRSMVLTEHRPDTVTVARMLRVCQELKVLKLGKEVHGQVLKRGFVSVHYVAAELIDMYGICGYVDKAKLVFRAIPVKGSMAWSALIRAYGYKEWYQEAVDLFDNMISNGCSPNRFTFEAVLSICDRAGFVEDAFRIFDLMSRYKIDASEEHCTCMIRLLTRYGKLDEVQRFVEMSSSL
ncbi:pentatricopeptide repeat-containing protein At1g71460, chloroplastic-like [Glycine soja]|uniref:Pentatricopeptide repeat-containing protein, chloroplastic n=2 Tax=Glycine soja TaxID=3848 RepID=A0A445LAH0_GLYSO|nr:pentatricopeptide repeat-containing protein At1g71460, chloroplastic-like [Glycine soja]RZC20107.1 Pentatricopeptide repeat-containing protein, chloroplastic [Glycine soja]